MFLVQYDGFMPYASATLRASPSRQNSERSHPEQWPLSLIAGLCVAEPLVGAVWQALFARSLGFELRWSHRLLLVGGLWLTYVCDHWFDCHLKGRPAPRTARHRFIQHNPGLIASTWLVVFTLEAVAAMVTLNAKEWFAASALLAGAGAYLALVHSIRQLPVLKETSMALVYAAGVTLFTWHRLEPVACVAALGFVALVLLNVSFIAVREQSVDRASGQTSIAIRTPRLGTWLGGAGWSLSAIACVGALFGGSWTPWYAALAGCAAVMSLVHEHASRLPSDVVHLVFDLMLLLPLPLLML